MLGKVDGASAKDGTSYLEIADFIIKNGDKPKEDLAELWKRIVFNMAVSNTDDHLRNHGFLLSEKGWRLSPAYDMNPNALGEGLALNVSGNDNSIDIGLALDTCKFYQLEKSVAEKIAADICLAVRRNWEKIALKYGANRGMIELMRPAFQLK